MRLSITCTLIVHNVSKHWVMQNQPFMKPPTSFIKGLNLNCCLGDFRRSLLWNEMMINFYIFNVLTTGKTSATTNKQRFESKNVIIRATVGYLSVFVFDIDLFLFSIFLNFLWTTNFVSVRPRFFFAVVDQFLLLKKSLKRQSSNILSVVCRSSFRHFNCSWMLAGIYQT